MKNNINISQFIHNSRNKKIARRVISLLCVITVFFTMNNLKKHADTLERIPTCGYEYDHVHTEDCYDEAGELICGLHEHTDACYQERPKHSDDVDLEDCGDVDGTVDEQNDVDLGELDGDEQQGETDEAVDNGETETETDPILDYTYDLNGSDHAFVSDIAAAMQVNMADVVNAMAIIENDGDIPPMGFEPIENDFLIYIVRDFQAAEIAIETTNELISVTLLNGTAMEQAGTQEETNVGSENADGNGDANVQENVDLTTSGDDGEDAGAQGDADVTVSGDDGQDAADSTDAVDETVQEETSVDLGEDDENGSDDDQYVGDQYVDDVDGDGDVTGETIDDDENGDVDLTDETGDTENNDDNQNNDVNLTDETVDNEGTEEDGLTEETADSEGTSEEDDLTEETTDGEEDNNVETTEEGEADETDATEEGEEEKADATEESEEDKADATEEGEEEKADADATEESEENETDATEEGEEDKTDTTEEGEADKADASEEGEEDKADATEEGEADEDIDGEETGDEADAESDADSDEADETSDAPQQAAGDNANAGGVTASDAGQGRHITVDLAEVESYPLSLRALLGADAAAEETGDATDETTEETDDATEETAEPAAETNSEPTVEENSEPAIEDNSEPTVEENSEPTVEENSEPAVEENSEPVVEENTEPVVNDTVDNTANDNVDDTADDIAEAAPVDAQIGESTASIGGAPVQEDAAEAVPVFDAELLAVETVEDDYLITPIADFERADIAFGRDTVTLLNGKAPVTHPAQTFTASTAYVDVVVTAPEGAFPAGTTMSVADVEDETTIGDITDTVTEDFVEVKRVHAVDITFTDLDGNEIEPLIPITVVMTVREIEQDEDAVVVHVDDEGNPEVVEQEAGAPEQLAVDTEVATEGDAASEAQEALTGEDTTSVEFVSDAFSVYAVVVTQTIETRYIDANGETWNISVGYGQDALLPPGAKLAVRELAEDESAEYYDQMAEALTGQQTIALARFFDITILDAEGNEIQPEAPVEVRATLAEVSEGDVKAVHFAEKGVEVLDAALEDDAVAFEASGFSVYGIVYTVDFFYDVDGITVEYHINGGDVLSLKALLPILGIVEEDAVDGFMENIGDVTFSDESLVKVVRVDEDTTAGDIVDALGAEIVYSGELTDEDVEAIRARTFAAPDWALVSLQPFFTEESLTLTMLNGDVVRVKVTDAQDNVITSYPSNAGYITVSGVNKGNDVRKGNLGYSNGKNQYRFAAEANPGYVFYEWRESDRQNRWRTQFLSDPLNPSVLKETMSMDVFDIYNHDLVAMFEPIKRRIGVDPACQEYGKVRVPINYETNTDAWYNDEYWNNNGKNAGAIEAIPNEGYVFVRWDYYEETRHDVWTPVPSGNLTQQRIEPGTFDLDRDGKGWFLKAVFQPAGVSVSVYNPQYGDVRDQSGNSVVGQSIVDMDGNVKTTIQAVPTQEDYVFGYWKLDDQILSFESDTISPENHPDGLANGNVLTAYFSKVIDGTDYATPDITYDSTEKEQFLRWLDSLKNNKELSVDKTAKVYDYDNRIYQIDISAESALVEFASTIDMGFILDVSNSMRFPAHLNRTDKVMTLTQESLNREYPDGSTHYIIRFPSGTSTVTKIFRKSDGQWYWVDSSFTDEEATLIDGKDRFGEPAGQGDVPFAYPIYDAVGSEQRINFLNSSLNTTLDSMWDILSKVRQAGGTSGHTIRVAHNTFARFISSDEGHDNQAPYECIDFAELTDGFNIVVQRTDGGTRQDKGMKQARETFSWGSSNTKYAILITDGAPVANGDDGITLSQVYDQVRQEAENLRNAGITLITVGLSTQNVEFGSNLLKEIASENPFNKSQKLFFQAENADDLEGILLKILRTVIMNKIVAGKIEDAVDPAFYPVKADGEPIVEGYYDKDGNYLGDLSSNAPSTDEWYQWVNDGGNWKITWNRQYMGWNPNSENERERPWQKCFYVKAKENFLGGNVISTNTSGSVKREAIYVMEKNDQGKYSLTLDHVADGTPIDLPVPHVNVDELSLTENDSEWTVYLGTQVDPLSELKALYNKIDVNEVVTQTVSDGHVTMTGKEDTIYLVVESNTDGRQPKDDVNPETFPLSDVAPLTDGNWATLIADGSVTVPYSAYNHSNVGNIVITLAKAVVDGEDGLTEDPHATKVVGDAVEKYTLKVTYTPTTESEPAGGWHTTPPNGSRGHVTNTMESTNEHVINVFAHRLAIKKVDSVSQSALTGAEFTVVKMTGDDVPTLTNGEWNYNNGQVVEKLTVGEDGTVISDYIPRPADDEKYYLIETKAPDSHIGLNYPVALNLAIEDWYREVPHAENADFEKLESAPAMPYDWQQKALLTLESTATSVQRTDENWQVNNDPPSATDESAILYCKISNSPGISLPSTGGIGTGIFYAAGSLLVLAALILLITKRRMGED